VIQVSAFSGGALPSDAGASDASAPPGAQPVLDAGADAGPSDAGGLDAATPPLVAADAGDAGTPRRVPQWTTQCRARAFAGVATRAECEPLQPVVD
jgi:hypothetical protein